MQNGADVRKVYVETDATSERNFKTIAEDISAETRPLDFLWVEFYRSNAQDTSAVVLRFTSDLAFEKLDNPRFTYTGGEDGNGMYVLTAGRQARSRRSK